MHAAKPVLLARTTKKSAITGCAANSLTPRGHCTHEFAPMKKNPDVHDAWTAKTSVDMCAGLVRIFQLKIHSPRNVNSIENPNTPPLRETPRKRRRRSGSIRPRREAEREGDHKDLVDGRMSELPSRDRQRVQTCSLHDLRHHLKDITRTLASRCDGHPSRLFT